MPAIEVSTVLSQSLLGKGINIMDHEIEQEERNLRLKYGSSEENSVKHDMMRVQARTYYELGQLVAAVDNLLKWAASEDAYIS